MFFAFSPCTHQASSRQTAVFTRVCLSVFISPDCLFRKMTFGKVNELGQFIRESEPEPDAKKSKGGGSPSLSLF